MSPFPPAARATRSLPEHRICLMLAAGEPTTVSLLSEGHELLDGRLVIRGVLGAGSMGVVYRAHDHRLGRAVAIKTLSHFDAHRLSQLKREFRTLAGLSHPNLVQLYELGAVGDRWFLIMELVEGVELGSWLRTWPARPRVMKVIVGLFQALRALHAAGQVHRDVKPSNVIVTPDDRAVLLDFGLAAPILDRPATTAAGTLDYMAREQLFGSRPSPAADWYSFGVVVFEALTGSLPFTGDERFVQGRRRVCPAALSSDVPPALDRIVTGLLEVDPDKRPGASELEEVLGLTAPVPPPLFVPEKIFVGRGDSLQRLHGALQDVRNGHARVIDVHGPSGIGKTALVRRFVADIASGPQALLLEGSCHPQESVPYKALDAVVDNLARHLIGLSESAVSRLAPLHPAALLRIFPVLGRVPGVHRWFPPQDDTAVPREDPPPSEIRRQGFGALRYVIAMLAARQPVVIWVDDIQWGDRDSGPALRTLLAPPDPPRILLVLTSRDDPGRHLLLDELREVGVAVDIALGPLPLDESRTLARQLSGGEPNQVDTDLIATEAGGSPFLLTELVRSVGELGRGRATGVSVGVKELVGSRLNRLRGDARRLLSVVAIAGRPLEIGMALDVGRVGASGRLLALSLCSDYLLRLTTIDDQQFLLPYHDRIRELAVDALSPGEQRAHHRHLADAIRASRNPDARALTAHYRAAGATVEATHFALLAAEEAERDLAFDQAVEMYDIALDLDESARGNRGVLERRAMALAHAARRSEAAVAFEAAARVAFDDAEVRLALRGQAAEQFFYGGELHKGLEVLQGVLGDVGVRTPAGPLARSIVATGLRARFLVSRPRVRAVPAPLDARTRARLDALWRVINGIVMLDHTLGDVLAGKHLLEALRMGDASRTFRALGLEAAFESNIGGPWLRRRSHRLLTELEEAARRSGHPFDRAYLAHCRACCAWFEGRWRASIEFGAEAEEGFRRVGGAAWYLTVLHGFMLSALAHRGDLRALSAKQNILIADAKRRGDMYALRVFRTGDAVLAWLAADEPDAAVRIADETLGEYRMDRFTSQHRHHLVATVQSHLYAGDAEKAWARVEQAWRPLQWSGFLWLECLGTQLRYLRASAAIARARMIPPGRVHHTLLGAAAAEARRIRRRQVPMAAPMAAAIEAALAGATGRRELQIDALRAACDGFNSAEMGLHREAARWHLADLLPDGEALREVSAAWMCEQGVVSAARMARALVPPV